MEVRFVNDKTGVMLCIGHLPASFSSADLRKLTEPHARVLQCWMARRLGGAPLGFGFVEVPTSADVEALGAGLSGVVLDAKPLSVAIVDTG